MAELKHRAQKESRLVELTQLPEELVALVRGELAELNQ
jgi:hypothetical protein